MAKSVASALVGSRFDYANSVLYDASANNIARLQRVQNALARVVLKSPPVIAPHSTAKTNALVSRPVANPLQGRHN
jgi:hypothetical protein